MSELPNAIFAPRYQLLQELAIKGGRKTFLALDTETDTKVVIKLLIFNADFRWGDLKLFEREAETLKSLDHPAIPTYLDYFDVDSPTITGFALVQSHIDAPSLAEQTAAGRTFSEAEVKEIAFQILEILQYLHSRQPAVVHRDIKPSNILLGDRSGNSVGQVYLVDFGSVQNVAAQNNQTLTVVGTYGYMPPEQFGGRAAPASDLYSLGATLIYLVTGKHPADLPETDLKLEFEPYCNLSPGFTNWLKQITLPSLSSRLAPVEKAMAALKNADAVATTNTHNLATKPANSRTEITRDSDRILLEVAPEGFTPKIVPTAFFTLFWNGFMIVWYGIALSNLLRGGWLMAAFGLLHLGVGLYLIYAILFSLFGKTKLTIDREQIVITREVFGFCSDRKSAPAKDIIRLELKRGHTYYDDGDRKKQKPGITIWSGTTKLNLGETEVLTRVELEWLAAELSDWLKLPVAR